MTTRSVSLLSCYTGGPSCPSSWKSSRLLHLLCRPKGFRLRGRKLLVGNTPVLCFQSQETLRYQCKCTPVVVTMQLLSFAGNFIYPSMLLLLALCSYDVLYTRRYIIMLYSCRYHNVIYICMVPHREMW